MIILLARESSITSLRAIAASEGFVIAAGEGGKYKTTFQMTGLLGLIIHYTYEVHYPWIGVLKINFHNLGFGLLLVSLVFSLSSALEYFGGFLEAIESFQEESSDGGDVT